jgi:hypothetical protein
MTSDSRLAVLQRVKATREPPGYVFEHNVRAGAEKIACSASIVVISTAARIS